MGWLIGWPVGFVFGALRHSTCGSSGHVLKPFLALGSLRPLGSWRATGAGILQDLFFPKLIAWFWRAFPCSSRRPPDEKRPVCSLGCSTRNDGRIGKNLFERRGKARVLGTLRFSSCREARLLLGFARTSTTRPSEGERAAKAKRRVKRRLSYWVRAQKDWQRKRKEAKQKGRRKRG